MEKKIAKNIFTIMAAKYNLDQDKFLQTIKNTVIRPDKNGKEATLEEIAAFLIVANKYGLDPFTNEIYAYPSRKGGIIPVVGVDGFVSKINNHPQFNGMEISFSEDIAEIKGAKPCPEWCEVKLYRKNIERPVIVREYLDEVYRELDYANPWKTHTKRMLRHKAIIQAGRAAGFLTGVYDEDEAQRILEAEIIDSTPAGKPNVEMPQAIEQTKSEPRPEKPDDKPSTEAQQKAIHTLANKVYGKDGNKLYDRLMKDFSVDSTKDLNIKQAGKFIEQLSKEINGK